MEHIVQFAIGIDDKTIQNRIEEYAYKDVLDKIVKETMDTVFAHTNAYSRENMWKTMMEDALQRFLEERKDEIIDKAANMLGYSGSMLSCLTYEDTDNSDPSDQPQVGDYGVAVLENADGQEEIPFHIEQEEHTGLPVAVLNTQLYAKPEDDIDDGQYVSLLQLYLDGFMLSRTGRKAAQDQSEDTNVKAVDR